MEHIFSILKHKLFYALLVIIYIVNSAMSFNEKYNPDKLNAYYNSFEPTDLKEKIEVKAVIAFAKKQLGKPYKPAGKGPDGFDCSGFTGFIFKHFGVRLPASARSQANVGSPVDIEEIQPGDLAFFKGANIQSRSIGHVGIVTAVNENSIKFIHSSSSKGIIINDLLLDDYYSARYTGARRVLAIDN